MSIGIFLGTILFGLQIYNDFAGYSEIALGSARLLGVREGAEPLLNALSARTRIPVVTRATALRGDPVFDLECRATDVWALLHDAPELRRMGREFREKFIRQG